MAEQDRNSETGDEAQRPVQQNSAGNGGQGGRRHSWGSKGGAAVPPRVPQPEDESAAAMENGAKEDRHLAERGTGSEDAHEGDSHIAGSRGRGDRESGGRNGPVSDSSDRSRGTSESGRDARADRFKGAAPRNAAPSGSGSGRSRTSDASRNSSSSSTSDRPWAKRPASGAAPAGERRSPAGPRDEKRRGGWEDRKRDDKRPDASRREYRPERGGVSADSEAARPHNARDLRSANRPDRERSPEIDEDVKGDELDRVTRAQIRNLEERSALWVAKHLVMAGRLIDDDPELAFQHALAASRRGGRLAAVREAVGLTAYAAGHYGEALREFRTFRRISGSNVHLPVMADCERGLGRPDRALDLARGEEAETLDAAGKAELAMVVSGARADLGQLDASLAALEIPQLDLHRAFSFTPRLFRVYAAALDAVGRTSESGTWRNQARVAESALGLDDPTEPDIIDLGEDDDVAPVSVPRVAEVMGGAGSPVQTDTNELASTEGGRTPGDSASGEGDSEESDSTHDGDSAAATARDGDAPPAPGEKPAEENRVDD
ncbi:hypothetical protein [Arthrobacter sp. Br18]|uniref:hypothetical protein n=1 Tax=Arthrobacter sp. Br18 TaxID=1312954 RepID=UPI0020A6359E|nr:hypothetical protein [Arthrobacter sp. Br18]